MSQANIETARVFRIPTANLATFEARFAKLARKAAKLDVPVPTYTTVGESHEVRQVETGEFETDQWGREIPVVVGKVFVYSHIVISNHVVKCGDFRFVATIEHTEEGNILHSVPGTATLPIAYRTVEANCDHCKAIRRRRETYIVLEEKTNTYKQVGSTCLVDFLGHDAERAAAMAELMAEVGELGEACEGGSFGGYGGSYDILDHFLAFVAEVIKLEGWRSNTTVKEYGGESTSNIAQRHMRPSKEDIRENRLLFRTPSPESYEVAKLAIDWASNISDAETESSDYLHNIRIIARRGIVSSKQYGYAASIVSGYQRHIGDLKRKEYQAKNPSTYIGTVGERQSFKVLVGKVITMDGMYGTTHLHLMTECGTNNAIVWKSSGECLEGGKEYYIVGTVKDHAEYKGNKQTILTRCYSFEMKSYTASVDGKVYDITAEDEKDARKKLLGILGKARLPKGATISMVTEGAVSA